MRIKEVQISKHSNSFCFIIPKAYVKDGNLVLGDKYNLKIEGLNNHLPNPLDNEFIAEKTQEIIMQQTKNANKTY